MKMPQRLMQPMKHWKCSSPFRAALLFGVLIAGPAGAAPGDKFDVLRDLAGRVGAVVGSALTCKDIARPRVQVVVDKFTAVIREASANETERNDLTQALDRGVTEGRIDVYNYGPGFSKVWFSGIVDAINIATTTPIDNDRTQVRFNFIVRKFDDEQLTSTVADAFVKEINKQVQEDRPIWEHKTFLPTPALADTDGPILKFRKWYSQFYAEPYEVVR